MIFETVREQIALPDAAQLYGISSRNGNIRCIFHADSNPSMKLYTDHFHCFGCGAHGDVTDFTAQLYGLSKLEAARKLCSDFGLSEEHHIAAPTRCRRLMTERERIQLAFDVLTDYIVMLKDFRTVYAPLDGSESLDPRFAVSLQQLDYAEYLWDMLLDLTDEERAAFITENAEQFQRYYDRLKQFGRLRPKLQRACQMSTPLKERTA
ncbi:MAG: DNA primase [Ruminococcus sp.]|nr:DNA primase [Ruminiclostridium sp.]MBP1536651.1 DNA primase [Ruminococcus sp.]MBP3856412.1 DNA primase [Ruminiclostridium sp.]